MLAPDIWHMPMLKLPTQALTKSSKGHPQRFKCGITDSTKPQKIIQGHLRDASGSPLLQTAILLEGSGKCSEASMIWGWWLGEAKNSSRDTRPLCGACVQAELTELLILSDPTQFSAFGWCLCSHQTDPLGKKGKTNQQQATLLSVSISFSDRCLSITGLQENMWLGGQMTNLRVRAVNFTFQDFLQICCEKSVAGNGASF